MDDFRVTKREVLVSIIIVSIMLLIGFVIHGNINDKLMLEYQKYNTALQIENDSNLFSYGMKTNIGNAFVYGDLEAVDTVTYPEIKGEYMYIEKVEKRYERHERTVTKEDSDGNTYTETEVYYEWETESRESQHSKEIKFCGVTFPYSKLNLPSSNYIETIKGDKVYSWKSGERVKVKFEYYGISTRYTGTIFADLRNNTIPDNTKFYNNQTIKETIDSLKSGWQLVLFWIGWILLTGGCVFGFYYIDNKWLEDKR
jgi:hypothetical protein